MFSVTGGKRFEKVILPNPFFKLHKAVLTSVE